MSAVAETMDAAPATTTNQAWRPSAAGWAARLGFLALVFGGLIYVTASVPQFWADRISLAAIYAIIGLSLNVVLGYVGQVSLGHHAFVGVAAFTSAAIVSGPIDEVTGVEQPGSPFFLGMLAAAAVGALSAGILGLVALRIKGLYLALITLTYGFVAVNSIFEIPALTGGGAGLPAPRPKGFETDREFAFLALAVLALIIYVDWRVMASKVGRAILAIKHSEAVAASYAVNVTAYKVLAFVLSGTFAGIAGGLFAHRATTVVANDFQFGTALLWVLMVVVGGLGNRTGVVIGSAFFALFPFLVELPLLGGPLGWVFDRLDSFFNLLIESERLEVEYTGPIGALLALLTIVKYPGGIGEQVSPFTRWVGGKRFTMHPEGHAKRPRPRPFAALRKRLGLAEGTGGAETGDAAATSAESGPSPIGEVATDAGEAEPTGAEATGEDEDEVVAGDGDTPEEEPPRPDEKAAASADDEVSPPETAETKELRKIVEARGKKPRPKARRKRPTLRRGSSKSAQPVAGDRASSGPGGDGQEKADVPETEDDAS